MPQEPTILVKKADGTSVRVPLSSLGGVGSTAEDASNEKQTASNEQSAIVSSVQETRNKKQDASNEKQVVATNVQRSANSGHSLIDSSKREISNKKQDARNKMQGTSSKEQVAQVVPQQTDQEVRESQSPIPNSQSLPQNATSPLPTPSTPHELATVTPVNHFFENVSRARTWTADDHVSPLEESLPESAAQEAQSVVSHSRYADVGRVSEALSFTIPPALESRLHSLIASRVKDVRNDDQVRAYARNASEEGGLDLSDAQADELVQAIHSALAVKKETVIPAPRTTPFGGRVPQAPPAPAQPAMSVPVQPTSSSASVVPTTRSLSDIHPPVTPQRESMGPVDELASMSLVDFRRLSKDPRRAVTVLQEKMATMREESYLEYVKMSQAWIRSPLYREYLSYLEASLDQSRSLQDVLSGSDMTPEDVAVFSEFSESVRVT